MKEKDFQREFGHWLESHPQPTTVFELKICKGISIPFDAVREHQVAALSKARDGHLYHKIQDSPVSWGTDSPMRFTAPKPFDCFVISKAFAYIVIWPYIKGQRKGVREMIWVEVEKWVQLMESATKKSIRIAELKEHAEVINF